MGSSVSRALELPQETGLVPGRGVAIQALEATIGEIARTDIPVLLQGESGTGKDVYARLIHRLSGQSHLPLKKLSCTVLETGQFLTAVNRYLKGDGEASLDTLGALFLDGVDELDVDCQKVLLAMLQQRETEGSDQRSMRLIATATRNLERETENGRFRRELYFRIAGACLRLPALRERKEDIPALMEHFLEKHAAEMGRKAPSLGEEEIELLLSYAWPGNIRELANLAKKIAALGDARMTIAEMRRPWPAPEPSGEGPRATSLKAAARTASRIAERDLILKALERTHWNRKQAARELQISYKALLYKIKQMDVEGAPFKNVQGDER
ncbi:MAG TPA: sigma 54-interacting transcriptional regulator [Dongiaceae bacterium]|nr:sigma 54-interacting transcriptional regulator [Dongiaceae bacterium]